MSDKHGFELLEAVVYAPCKLEVLLTDDEKFWISDSSMGHYAWESLHERFPEMIFLNAIEIIRAYAIWMSEKQYNERVK